MIGDSKIFYSLDVSSELRSFVNSLCPKGVFVIADSNVAAKVIPAIGLPAEWNILTFPAGEESKNLTTCMKLWATLTGLKCTRSSLIINIGGGVTTDMGGFVAATFKRGITFINVATTLLGAVDAAIGGKTGVDFEGLKNQIGAFAPASAVFIDSTLFSSLPREELLSGYGEMIKHSLLHSRAMLDEILELDIESVTPGRLNDMLRRNIAVKSAIVKTDPFETGLRKSLNLGHTFGHALETFCLKKGNGIPHGIAVAHGLLVSLILSHIKLGLDSGLIQLIATLLRNRFNSVPAISCKDYEEITGLMAHDKKNIEPGHILFTLLRSPGEPVTDVAVDTETISTALDIYRDLCGI